MKGGREMTDTQERSHPASDMRTHLVEGHGLSWDEASGRGVYELHEAAHRYVPGQWCSRCGIGPFFTVPERPRPDLCLDCAGARRDGS